MAVAPSDGVVRTVSRFQFARPAVVWSLLVHLILIPPVAAVSSANRPLVIVSSSSRRNASAVSCLRSSNSFFAALCSAPFLQGFVWRGSCLAPVGKASGENAPCSSRRQTPGSRKHPYLDGEVWRGYLASSSLARRGHSAASLGVLKVVLLVVPERVLRRLWGIQAAWRPAEKEVRSASWLALSYVS